MDAQERPTECNQVFMMTIFTTYSEKHIPNDRTCGTFQILTAHTANVLNMASRVPANLLGILDRGSLKVGNKAGFILLSDDLLVKGA
jgi:N-acyl-D-aspartate/D-glutamate deacylase